MVFGTILMDRNSLLFVDSSDLLVDESELPIPRGVVEEWSKIKPKSRWRMLING